MSSINPLAPNLNQHYTPDPDNDAGSAPDLEATAAASKEDNKKIAALGREARWQVGLKSVADSFR